MKNENRYIDELKKAGYGQITAWDKVTAAGSMDHSHPFDTRLVVLEGEIEISLDGQARTLGPSDKIDIPRGVLHHSKAAPGACKYITAEKH